MLLNCDHNINKQTITNPHQTNREYKEKTTRKRKERNDRRKQIEKTYLFFLSCYVPAMDADVHCWL